MPRLTKGQAFASVAGTWPDIRAMFRDHGVPPTAIRVKDPGRKAPFICHGYEIALSNPEAVALGQSTLWVVEFHRPGNRPSLLFSLDSLRQGETLQIRHFDHWHH